AIRGGSRMAWGMLLDLLGEWGTGVRSQARGGAVAAGSRGWGKTSVRKRAAGRRGGSPATFAGGRRSVAFLAAASPWGDQVVGRLMHVACQSIGARGAIAASVDCTVG